LPEHHLLAVELPLDPFLSHFAPPVVRSKVLELQVW
jgi:hypothetical protein